MKLIVARDTGTEYHFVVHLDSAKTVKDESAKQIPDPAWLVEYTWPKDQPLAVSKREMKLLAELELAKRKEGPSKAKKLLEEGKDF